MDLRIEKPAVSEGDVDASEKITRQDLALEATLRLAQLVASSQPGARLPTERELCERLGVGRSTLREAVSSLAFTGAIQSRQGSGTFVTGENDLPVERLIGLGLMLQRSTVEEVIEVRRILEVEAVRLAAERHDESDRRALEAVMAKMSELRTEPSRASRYDVEFHVLLTRASHNSALVHLVNGMRSLLEIWITKAVNEQSVVNEIVREHNAILRAVFSRQSGPAAASMLIHLTNAAERLFAVVGKDRLTANYIALLLASRGSGSAPAAPRFDPFDKLRVAPSEVERRLRSGRREPGSRR
ncbi:MAG: FCD domain-containing protein [Luteitalea sp.]|nr:FCD domain-containing protein [Luteitalea sp.]